MDAVDAAELAETARRTHAEARQHKRLADRHRRQAQRLMAEYARLVERCAQHGITVHLTQASTKGESQ